MTRTSPIALLAFLLLAAPRADAQALKLLEAPCLADTNAPVTDPETARTFLLDYPCDLRANEPVTVILNLHGGGSSGIWQRRYFPAFDYKDKYRLIVASPYSPIRRWEANDDEYLRNIVSAIVERVGPANVRSFWLVGHSQGGATSRRIICSDFFKTRVDGFLSLSGGRVGGAPERDPGAGRPAQRDPQPPRTPPAGTSAAAPASAATAGAPAANGPASAAAAPVADPDCDFSHIYETGEHEIVALPVVSKWAEKYSCGARVRRPDVIDTAAGHVHDGGSQNPGTRQWGLLPRPGTAELFAYPNCSGNRLVADVRRLDKGHTEGLEPHITEELVRMMAEAPGGKIKSQR